MYRRGWRGRGTTEWEIILFLLSHEWHKMSWNLCQKRKDSVLPGSAAQCPSWTWCPIQPRALWGQPRTRRGASWSLPPSLPPAWLIWCSLPRGFSTAPGTVLQVRYLASFTGTSPLKNNALWRPGQENKGRIELAYSVEKTAFLSV